MLALKRINFILVLFMVFCFYGESVSSSVSYWSVILGGGAEHGQYLVSATKDISKPIGPDISGSSRLPYQCKSFYANGLWWLFYADKTGGISPYPLYYITSADGLTWSSPISVGVNIYTYDANWSLAYDTTNNKVWVLANLDNAGGFWQNGYKGRRATPNSDGSLTWDVGWQTIIARGHCVADPTAIVDSNGYLWVGYMVHPSGNNMNIGDAWVIKNSVADGTWSTAASFPVKLSSANDGRFAHLVSLGGGNVYAVSAKWGSPAVKSNGYLFLSGQATFSTETNITESNVESSTGSGTYVPRIHAYGIGDGVTHIVYQDSAANIKYAKRQADGSMVAEQTLATGVESAVSSPQIALDDSNSLYVFYSSFGSVYGTNNRSGLWETSMPIFSDSYNSSYERLNISREVKNNQILLETLGAGGVLRVRTATVHL